MQGFTFEDGERTYTCAVEAGQPPRSESWWWFKVTGDGNRYAPFPAASNDTRESVRTRIVAFYDNRLAHKAMPYGRR